jgi:pimeloyl-ACP methyl ester carboxylesterase
MRAAEVRDVGRFAGASLGEIAELARDVHRAVAHRIFAALGGPAVPVRRLHDVITAVAYGASRLGVRAVPIAAGSVAARAHRTHAESVHDGPRASFVVGALNGWAGDRLVDRQPELATRMRLRTESGRLRTRPGNVVHDVGSAATPRVVVFVPGLCETDRFWQLGTQRAFGAPTSTYGAQLRDEQGWTPLYVSYNTGRHVSVNGADLARLLEDIVAGWPVPVTELAIVGHSMGGLVARSAAQQAELDELAWVARLRHIVGLGTPHLGAPLERFANVGTWALARLPETRPFAAWLNRRSAGIKDMRYGAVVEADWLDADPDELLHDRCTAAELLPHVQYSTVSATLGRVPTGRPPLTGDLLVWHGSATGVSRGRRIGFDAACSLHVGGRHHFQLLADPAVYAQLRTWFAERPASR